MPAGDGLGPRGSGPMTGRRAGFCAGYQMPGHANCEEGRGGGRGYGGGPFGRAWGGGADRGRRGHCHRHWFRATGLPGWARAEALPASLAEREILEQQASRLQGALDSIRERLQRMEPDKPEGK